MAYRVDIGSLRPPQRMPDGRLRCDGLLTRTGVFTYVNPDGSQRREYRPPDEVFRDDSLASFAGVPITDNHPAEPVSAANARQYTVGLTGDRIQRADDHVVASLTVFDAATIAKMEAGKTALSCGYEVDLREEPGVTPGGERYDAIQTNIRGNHVALVDRARAGESARVRMDAAVMTTGAEAPQPETPMNESPTALALAEQAVARADAAEARIKELESQLAAEKVRADAAEAAVAKARTDAASDLDARVRGRIELERAVAPLLGDVAGKSDRDVKVELVRKVDGDDVATAAAGLDDKGLDVVFRSAAKRADAAVASAAAVRGAVDAARKDSNPTGQDAVTAARADMIERNRNAWRTPAGA